MLLNVQNLHIEIKQGNNKQVLCRNLDFAVNPGETIGILGESGSGKSITALSILRLLPPSLHIARGSIGFTTKDKAVIDLAQVSAGQMRHVRGKEIAMVFQEPMSSLNPVFTCGNQLLETMVNHEGISWLYGLTHRKQAKEFVLELFHKVKLPDPNRIFQSYPHQLSGGQKQRVMIAMAIAGNPSLLIADEPTTALDVTVQKSVLQLLRELQSEMGMSIMFITHDISVLAEIAQKVLVFYQGEIVEQGQVRDIFTKAGHPYTRGLIGCRSAIYNKGERLLTLEDIPASGETGQFAVQDKKHGKYQGMHGSEKEETSLLSIRNLDVCFHHSDGLFGHHVRKRILHQVSFDVFRGETLGLVGESGSGKTTIGRTIMQLIRAESGDILFLGQPLSRLFGKQLREFRKKVQVIFQDPYSSLNPKMTVGPIITEPMVVHHLGKNSKDRKHRVMELLHQVHLEEEHYYRYPHQFSGGQRQRIGIARALAVEPQLIILDESVAALDVSIQAQVLNLLNDLKQAYGLTYIFISHDLNTVRYMSDRMVVLKDGYVVEQGVAEEVFAYPKSEYTSGLIAAIPGKNVPID
jgi:peptide/nickel transport system ATP-binding protein